MASLKYTVDVDTKGAKSSIASLQNSLGGLGATVAGAFAVGEIVAFGDSIIGLQNKLRSLTGDQALVSGMFNDITRIAGAARAPLQETGDLYFRIARAAKDLGISQQETSDITESLAKSMSMTGATAQETSGALLQLGQALQSGRFQGDELRSVLENMPIVSKAMADELGVTIGELRKLGSEGKITSDVFVSAMQKNKKAIDDAFARSVPTAMQALNNLKTAAGIAFSELATEPGVGKSIIDIAGSLLTLTNDVKQLSVVIKELIEVLTILGLTFAAVKAVAIIGPILASASTGVTKLAGSIGAVVAEGKVLSTVLGSLKSGAGGLGTKLASAFSLTAIKGSISTIINLGKNMGQLIPIMLKTGNIFTGVRTIIGAVIGVFGRLVGILPLILKGFLKFIPIAGWIWTIWEAIDALLKLFTGNGIVYWLGVAADKIDNFFEKFLGVRIISDYVVPTINALMDKLRQFAEYVGVLDKKTPKGGNTGGREAPGGPNRAVTDAFDASMAGKKNDVFGDASTKVKPGGDGGKSAAQTAKDQAKALNDVKKAVIEVTAAYREQAKARLDDLKFQLDSLGMSEDQVQIEQNRRDIIKEQADALKTLADKTLEVEEAYKNKEISNKGRQEALALIAQETAAINAAADAQVAASEKEIKAIQAKNLAFDEQLKKTGLLQKANENKAALQAIEDQLTLVGLYGDKLDEVTAQLELQQQLRANEVAFQNQLLELEDQKLKLGEKRFNMEKAILQQSKADADAAAKATAAAQKKVDDAQKKSERNDIGAALGKRFEELERSVDPAVTAVEGLNSLFSNMGSALDNFVDTGKLKFGDFAKSVIADIAKIALKAAVTKLFTLVGKAILGPKAAGGPVMANKPYVVGEQGPELFVPNSAGSIMTNASMNKNAGADSGMGATVNNTYITNNISAIDSRSVAQMFVENRKSLLGASMMARKEMPYGG